MRLAQTFSMLLMSVSLLHACNPPSEAVLYEMRYCSALDAKGPSEFDRAELWVKQNALPWLVERGFADEGSAYGRWYWTRSNSDGEAVVYIENRVPGMGLTVTYNSPSVTVHDEQLFKELDELLSGNRDGFALRKCADVFPEFEQNIWRMRA